MLRWKLRRSTMDTLKILEMEEKRAKTVEKRRSNLLIMEDKLRKKKFLKNVMEEIIQEEIEKTSRKIAKKMKRKFDRRLEKKQREREDVEGEQEERDSQPDSEEQDSKENQSGDSEELEERESHSGYSEEQEERESHSEDSEEQEERESHSEEQEEQEERESHSEEQDERENQSGDSEEQEERESHSGDSEVHEEKEGLSQGIQRSKRREKGDFEMCGSDQQRCQQQQEKVTEKRVEKRGRRGRKRQRKKREDEHNEEERDSRKKAKRVLPRYLCHIENCQRVVMNLPRHLRQFHNMDNAKDEMKSFKACVLQSRQRYTCEQKICPFKACSVKTGKMDLHLKRQHNIVRGSHQFHSAMSQCDLSTKWNLMDSALADYVDCYDDQVKGRQLSKQNSDILSAAVKTFLPNGLSRDTLTELHTLDWSGGPVEGMQKQTKLSTVRYYLISLSSFIKFLSRSFKWQKQLKVERKFLVTLQNSLLKQAWSLNNDVCTSCYTCAKLN